MSQCLSCRTEGAYVGFTSVECPNQDCVYYCEELIYRGMVFTKENPEDAKGKTYVVDLEGKTFSCAYEAIKKKITRRMK